MIEVQRTLSWHTGSRIEIGAFGEKAMTNEPRAEPGTALEELWEMIPPGMPLEEWALQLSREQLAYVVKLLSRAVLEANQDFHAFVAAHPEIPPPVFDQSDDQG